MTQPYDLDVAFAAKAPADAEVLIIPVARDGVDAAIDAVGAATNGAGPGLRAASAAAAFDGSAGTMVEHFAVQGDSVQRIMLIGTGDGKGRDLETAGGALIARLLVGGTKSVAVMADGLDAAGVVALAHALQLRSWRYDKYRTKLAAKQRPSLRTVTIIGATANDDWAKAQAVAAGVALTRELVTEPANIIYPESFVARCRELSALGVEIDVLDEKQMQALGMGALLGVAQGSARPPRLLVMRWDGSAGKAPKPVCLVGKGVTFDTGGISIKPAAGMEDMKWDMGGAGAVAGAMKAIAGRKSTAHVVGICGLVENMPDGLAQRPGDVVTSMSGQTIEVINTDAEGRLVLCDALTWAQKTYAPEVIVDLATLTGAMIISLGNEYGGMFANDDGLAAQLSAAGVAVGEPLWRMPLGDAYDKLIDSPIADIKNVGPREAGSITAAQFLKRFIDDGVKWAHLDIAGMVWSAKATSVYEKGATGYGVRLLDRFIADNFE